MDITIKIRRGDEPTIPTLSEGEMGYCLDTDRLFIGNNSVNKAIGHNIGYDKLSTAFKTNSNLSNLTNVPFSSYQTGRHTLTSDSTLSFSGLQKGKSFILDLQGDYTLTLPSYCLNVGSQTYEGGSDRFFIVFECLEDTTSNELVIYTINKVQ